MTRAVKQLEATGLFRVSKAGVNKVIESTCGRLQLFEKSKQYLSTPVVKTGYIEKSEITENMVFAGDTVLAEKSMLNLSRIVTYAISEKDFDKKLLVDELIDPEEQIRLELWKYNPVMFAKNNTADSLSVALSFSENKDERIEEAVEEMVERELQE